jgi:O-antigen/teichoic acid export membrane protein
MQQSHRIIYNTLTSYAAAVIQGAVSFFFVPFLLRYLGETTYGIIVLCTSALTMSDVVGSAISKAVTKYVAEYRAKEDTELANQVFNSALLWFLMFGLAGGLIFSGLAVFIGNFVGDLPKEMVSEARTSIFIVAATSFVCLTMDSFMGLLWAEQRYDLVNINTVLRSILHAVAVVGYVLLIKPSVVAVVVIMGIMRVSMRFGFAYQCFRTLPWLKISTRYLTWSGAKIIIAFASMVLLVTVANIAGYEMVKFIIGNQFGLDDVTRYGIMAFVVMFSFMLMTNIGGVMVPVASKYQGLGNMATVGYLFSVGTKYANIAGVGLLVVSIPLLGPFLSLWVGPKYVELVPLIVIMGISQILAGCSSCTQQVLSGLGKNGFVAVASLMWAFLGVGAAWSYAALVPAATLGGFVIIVSIARGLGTLAIVIYGMAVNRVDKKIFIYSSFIKPAAIGLLGCLLGFILTRFLSVDNWFMLTASAIVVEAAYFGLAFFLCLDGYEKKMLTGFCSSALVKVFVRGASVGKSDAGRC